MAVKEFDIPAIGTVQVYKRRGVKHIRLSVTQQGTVRVTIPSWVPYRSAMTFIEQKREWILQQQAVRKVTPLESTQRIGKYHTLQFVSDDTVSTVRTRTTTNVIKISHPIELAITSGDVQKPAQSAAQKALRQEAEQLLPQRLKELATKHQFSYQSLSVRNLKTRWGSCDSKKHITLNYYLMQLPWSLIDYVLVHELVHTVHLNHSPEFWEVVENSIPDYKARRKALKEHQPSIVAL